MKTKSSVFYFLVLILFIAACSNDDMTLSDDDMMTGDDDMMMDDDTVVVVNDSACTELQLLWQTDIPVPEGLDLVSIYGTELLGLGNGQIVLASHSKPNLSLLEANGDTLWTFHYDPVNSVKTHVTGLAEMDNGNIMISGRYRPSGMSQDEGFVAAIDPNKTIIWEKQITDFYRTNNYRLLKLDDGNYLLYFDDDFGSTGRTRFYKLDAQGQTIGISDFNSGFGTSTAVQTDNGNILVILSQMGGGLSGENLTLLHLSQDLGIIGQRIFFNELHYNPTGLVNISDSEAIACGFFDNTEFLAGLSTNGDTLWRVNWDDPNSERERIYYIDKMEKEDEFIYVSFVENQGFNGYGKIAKVTAQGDTTTFSLQLNRIRPNVVKRATDGYLIAGYDDSFGSERVVVTKVGCIP